MTTMQVIPPSTFRQIPGTAVDIAVERGPGVSMEVTSYRSDEGGSRVEVSLTVHDTTITLRVPRGTEPSSGGSRP